MNKSMKYIFVAFALLLCMGCENFMSGPTPRHNLGAPATVELRISSSTGEARTIAPNANPSIASYDLLGIRAGGTEANLAHFTEFSEVLLHLEPGSWTFTLRANRADGKPILEAVKANVELVNEPVNLSFTLEPLSTGQGSLQVQLSWPASVDAVSLVTELNGSSSTAIDISSGDSYSYSANLAKGGYLVFFHIKDSQGRTIITVPEYAEVLPNMISSASYSLSAEHFNSPPVTPSNFTVISGGDLSTAATAQVDFSWTDASVNETAFEIEYSSNGSNWSVLSDGLAAASTGHSAALNRGQTLQFRIRSSNSFGESAWSAPVSFDVPWLVSFDSGDGSAVSAQEVTQGGLVTQPSDPSWNSGTFNGWYSDAGLSTAWNFSTGQINGNTTIHAKWTLDPNPATDFLYTISGGEVTIDKYIGTDTTVVIPSTIEGYPVTALADKRSSTKTEAVFYENSAVESIYLPDTITEVGGYAFYFCTSLRNVRWSENLTTIGQSVLLRTALTSIVLPDSVVSTGSYAFEQMRSLESFHFGKSFTTLGGLPFTNCDSLERFTIDSENANFEVIDGVLYNEARTKLVAYPIGSPVSNFRVPDSVTEIQAHSISGANHLREIHIGPNVDTLEFGISCPNMERIVVDPSNATYETVDGVLFVRASSMLLKYPAGNSRRSYSVPLGTLKVEGTSFMGAKNLETVTIPSSVTSIGPYAFSHSTVLSEVYFEGSVPPVLNRDPFINNGPALKLFVPLNALADYQNAASWASYTTLLSPYAEGEVKDLTASVENSGEVTLRWTNPDSADFDHVEIFYGMGENAAIPFNGVIDPSGTVIGGFTSNGVGFKFLVQVVDSSGSSSQGLPVYATPFHLDGDAGLDMITVTSGTFTMGDFAETPEHQVTLTSDFALGKYEVTWSQWNEVLRWAWNNGYSFMSAGMQGNGNDGSSTLLDDDSPMEPVTSINYGDAIAWCNAASEYEGLTPAYSFDGSPVRDAMGAWVMAECDWTANGYRLPSEAEWEYAAKGGHNDNVAGMFAGSETSSDVAWDYNNSNKDSYPVGMLQPNEIGIYDMNGNVSEWVWKLYGGYTDTSKVDPVEPISPLVPNQWLHRGGSYADYWPKTTSRYQSIPIAAEPHIGFRVARSLNGGFVPDTTPPGSVTALTVTPMNGEAVLKWTDPADLDLAYVRIYYSDDSWQSMDLFAGTVDSAGTTIGGLTPGVRYDFAVQTVDQAGLVSAPAFGDLTILDSIPPGEVSNLVATPGNRSITLSWTNPGDADFDHVEIKYIMASSTLTYNGTIDPLGTTISGLGNGTEYSFHLRTFDTTGNGSTGVTISGTPDGTPPAEVSNVSATPGDKEVVLTWDVPADPDYHHSVIKYGRYSADTLFTGTVDPSGTTVSGLVNGDSHRFTVHSSDAAGNLSAGVLVTCTPDYIEDGSTGILLETIPAGSFTMGDNSSSNQSTGTLRADSPAMPVTITSDYAMGKYEVTYAQWKEVFNWAVANGYSFDRVGEAGNSHFNGGDTDDEPVTNVTARDMIAWCNAASEYEGLTPVYSLGGLTYRDSTQIGNPDCSWNSNGYRLPTEAEWEYAARGGESYYYAGSNILNDVAWYDGNSGDDTHPVGLKAPNGYGLYDMSGNVYEWCWNYDYEYFSTPGAVDPVGMTDPGILRMMRGGSFSTYSSYMKLTVRSATSTENNMYGFRVARTLNGSFSPDVTPPGEVTNLVANHVDIDHFVTLTWTNPGDADLNHFEIYYGQGSDPDYARRLFDGVENPAGTKIDQFVDYGSTYTFKIRCFDRNGNASDFVITTKVLY